MAYDAHIWHPYTRFSARGTIPVIQRAEGIWLYDHNEHAYLDAISSWWCVNLGHGHPHVVAAIQRQAEHLQHSILGNLSHPGAMHLAEQLVARFASPQRHVLFAADGASANEAGLKVAVQYFHNLGRPRTKFLALQEPYHGDTLGAVSVGYMPSFHRPLQPLLFDCLQLAAPTDETNLDAALARLDQLLDQHGQELAALVVEPLCRGAAGMKMYPPRFLTETARRCRQAGALVMVDEIAMGYGRTGTFFAHEQAGIDPDIVTTGKGMSAGYLPISATTVRDEIYATFDDAPNADHTLYHGHTFAGNPLAVAAALATLEVYDQTSVVDGARQRGAHMASQLAELNEVPTLRNLRNLGMIAAVDLSHPAAARAAQEHLRQNGILVRPLGETLYLMPPLNITTHDLERLCTAFISAVRTAANA